MFRRHGRTSRQRRGREMDFEALFAKTPATLDELRTRVFYALQRHPMCRSVEFDIVSTPRTRRTNWTITIRSVAPGAMCEANETVAHTHTPHEPPAPPCFPAVPPPF